jgi:replication factor C large subunit
MEKSLVRKYKPESFSDVYGHPTAVGKIKKWADNWEQGTQPILLYGPPGTGKTSTAEVAADYADWNYEEINASSQRRTEDIEKLAQELRSVGDTRTLYTLDEVDSMDGRSLQPLYQVLESSVNPVICTANEKWKVPDGLENRCQIHKFKLRQDSIKKFLKDVVRKEDIDISNRQIGQLATRNGIRDALNDLQGYVESGETDWDQREMDDSPFAVTRRIILNENYIGDMTPDDMVAFLNENVKNEFDGVEAMRSYQALGEADKWLGHVERTQDYSWWRYAGAIAEEVSNLRITEPYNDWVNVNYPAERRNWTPKASDNNNEAQLYRELQSHSSYSGAFNYQEFRKVILPLLRKMDEQERMELCLSYSLSTEASDALDISQSDFDEWQSGEVEKQMTDSETTLDEFVEEETEEETKGLFDY